MTWILVGVFLAMLVDGVFLGGRIFNRTISPSRSRKPQAPRRGRRPHVAKRPFVEESPEGRRGPHAATREPEPDLQLELDCVNCGGPVRVGEEGAPLTCDHCGSWLVARRPRDYDVLFSKAGVATREQLRRLLIRAQVVEFRKWAERYMLDGEGNPAPEDLIERAVSAEEDRLELHLRLGPLTGSILVPYWHEHGLACRVALGRDETANWPELRLRGRRWEVTTPAYDSAAADLRDRMGRLGISGCRPLTRADVDVEGQRTLGVVRSVPAQERVPGPSDRDGGFEELVAVDGEIWGRTDLVFKLYWVAERRIARGTLRSESEKFRAGACLLVDATRGSISAALTASEARAMLSAPSVDPIEEAHTTRLRLVRSRCPECGVDLAPADGSWIVVCGNCHQGLGVSDEGLLRVPYSYRLDADLPDGERGWLPFWRFPFAVQYEGGEEVDRLENVIPELGDVGPAGSWLWVPASRLLGWSVGDEAFSSLVRWVHTPGRNAVVEDTRFPIGPEPGRILPASLPEGEGRALARAVLAAALPARSASRLRAEVFRRRIENGTLRLEAPRLVLVAAAHEGRRWHLPGIVPGIPEGAFAGSGRSG